MKYILFSQVLGAFLLFIMPVEVSAQSSCGNIIKIDESVIPIEDCDNPFSRSEGIESTALLTIDGNIVNDGDIVLISSDSTTDYSITGNPRLSGWRHAFYYHDGNDYVEQDLEPLDLFEISEEELLLYADAYAPIHLSPEELVNAFFNGPGGLDTDQINEVLSFFDYLEDNFDDTYPLSPGTYTLVTNDYLLTSSQAKPIERFFSLFVTTAHAQAINNYTYTLTFTIEEAPPEPTGASSVLFLPGIQASRLYQEGLFGTEDQVWEPNSLFSEDVRDLEMTDAGESINDIYTRDVLDEIFLPGVGKNIYKSFINFMDDLVDDDVIAQWQPFAYDWRYDVFDVVESGAQYENDILFPVAIVEELAANSKSGNVTIVAHSNGGLLAKTIMMELEQQGLDHLIDQVVFVGTPHLGAPKAIGTLLHGTDLSSPLSLIINDNTAREVVENIPGLYGLLPTETYINESVLPVISFEEAELNQSFIDAYGTSITGIETLNEFLKGTGDGRETIPDLIKEPSVANQDLLDEASLHHDSLDSYEFPEHVTVHEVAGTGFYTIAGIQYKQDYFETCSGGVCGQVTKRLPYALIDIYGDETVTLQSATGYPGEKEQYFIDLEKLEDVFFFSSFSHVNLTEIPELQSLLISIINSTSTPDLDYISQTEPAYTELVDVISLHSPVALSVTDNDGNKTSIDASSTEIITDIPGSTAFNFAGSRYVVLPKKTDYSVELNGYATGTYSLIVESVSPTSTVQVSALFGATSTPELFAEFSKTDDVFSTIVIDLDGDGEVDIETTLSGETVTEDNYTVADLYSAIIGLETNRYTKRILSRLVYGLEKYATNNGYSLHDPQLEGAWDKLEKVIAHFVTVGRINDTEAADLLNLINKLKNYD